MNEVLQKINTEVKKSNLINLPNYILPSVHLFASKYSHLIIIIIMKTKDTFFACLKD